MNFTAIFLLRLVGVVLIGAAAGAAIVRDSWGSDAIPALSWAALWACVLGLVGFRSLRKTMLAPAEKLVGLMLLGLLMRFLILVASQAVVFLVVDAEWGQRTLFATVLLYMLALGVEVVTLNGALRRGDLRRGEFRPGASSGNAETNDANAPAGDGGATEGSAGE